MAGLACAYAPALAIGDDAGEFAILVSLCGVFAALTAFGWVEDRLSRAKH